MERSHVALWHSLFGTWQSLVKMFDYVNEHRGAESDYVTYDTALVIT